METSISQTENRAAAPLQRQPNPRQRILVVEGETDIRRLNSEVLTCSGYQMDIAADGVAAWETLQLNDYDLLVTAQHLSKVSGVELIKKMHDTNMRLPVIMTTRTLPAWELATRPWLQPTTMVPTPYTTEEFLGTVKNVLHATDSAREEIASPPNWLGQPPTVGLQPSHRQA